MVLLHDHLNPLNFRRGKFKARCHLRSFEMLLYRKITPSISGSEGVTATVLVEEIDQYSTVISHLCLTDEILQGLRLHNLSVDIMPHNVERLRALGRNGVNRIPSVEWHRVFQFSVVFKTLKSFFYFLGGLNSS